MRLPFHPNHRVVREARERSSSLTGAVLLEVVLALALFVAAAAILTSGLSTSLDEVERLRNQAHAVDLAVSVISELQLGIKSLALNGPQPFEAPFEGWTWEVLSTPIAPELEETNQFKKIEVVIRHDDPELVYRLGQEVRLAEPIGNAPDRPPGMNSFQASERK